MASKTLICVIGELRSTEITYESFEKNVLLPNKADILLCIPDDKNEDFKQNLYYKHAKYIKVFDSTKNITTYYEEICKKYNGNTDWKKLLYIKKFWLGGITDLSFGILRKEILRIGMYSKISVYKKIRDICKIIYNRFIRLWWPLDQPSGAGYVLLYRHLLLEMIRELKLDEIYDRFVITRSDHMYVAPHPSIEMLDPEFVWIPEWEDWRGYCDRHWVLSREHLTPCLNLLKPIFCQTNTLFSLMKKRFDWNSESYIKLIFQINNIQVKRFTRTQFLVRGSRQSQTWTEGAYNENLKLTIAYPSEYESVSFKQDCTISVIGSCRVFNPIHTTGFKIAHQYATWNTHCTKEIIQKINIVNQNVLIPTEFDLFINQIGSLDHKKFHKDFYKWTHIFIIEISSVKKFMYNDFYCNQWAIRDILKKYTFDDKNYQIAEIINKNMQLQTEEEIIGDLDIMCTLLQNKIIFVNHINILKDDGSTFEERSLIHRILKKYCDNKNTFHFDPTEIVSQYPLKQALIDSGHYTPQFEKIIGNALVQFSIQSLN